MANETKAIDGERSVGRPPHRPSRTRGRIRLPNWEIIFWPAVALVVVCGVWQLLPTLGIVDPIILPPFSDVVVAAVELLQTSYFWHNTWITVYETLVGFGLGVFAAFVLGTLIGLSRPFRLAVYPRAVAFQNTPRVALAPLFFAWFGFGLTTKIVMAAAICFFPVLIGVVVGLDTVDRDAKTLMRSLGSSRWQMYSKLSLPASLPVIFAGVKQAITMALIGVIVAEFVGATEGMGVMIKVFNFQLEIAKGFAVIVALMVIGMLLYGIVDWIDRRVVFWHGH
jgi:NitT/TauT family transport system permease protein